MQAIRALGYTPEQLAPMVPCDPGMLHHLSVTQKRVATAPRDLFARVCVLFDMLPPAVGPDADEIRDAAQAHRFHGPLSWEDVDDPAERPCRDARWDDDDEPREKTHYHDSVDPVTVERVLAGEWHLPTTRAEKEEITARHLAAGGTWSALEERTGWHLEKYTKPKGDTAA